MGKHLGTGKSFRFTDDELALLDAMARRFGSQKAAVVAGLRALSGANSMSPEEHLRALGVHIAALEAEVATTRKTRKK